MKRFSILLTILALSTAAFASTDEAPAGDRVSELRTLLLTKGNVKGCDEVLVSNDGVTCKVDVCVESHTVPRLDCSGFDPYPSHYPHRHCVIVRETVCDRYARLDDVKRTFAFAEVAWACTKYGILNHKVKLTRRDGSEAKLVLDKRAQARAATMLIRDIVGVGNGTDPVCR